MMPAKSRAQQKLFAAAEHGATFPMARALRESLPTSTLRDFASGSMAGKPEHVRAAAHPIKNLKHFAHPPKRSK
jgi:hypothetical protein